jgi:hypothetical protein
MLDKEMKLFENNVSEWLRTQSEKFVLIKEEKVIGFFTTDEEAISEGVRLFGLSSFLVRPIISEQVKPRIPAMTIGVLNANPPQSIPRGS